MARSKPNPKKELSSHNKASVKNPDFVKYKSKSRSSPKKQKASSSSETFSEETFTDSDNTQAKSNKTNRSFSNKRKSMLPNKRKTFTDEFSYAAKSRYSLLRFGKAELCPRKTYQELKHFRKTTFLLIPKLPFSRLVREILNQFADMRISHDAFEALQESAEMHLVILFQNSNMAAAHAKRKTVMVKDMNLVRFLQKN